MLFLMDRLQKNYVVLSYTYVYADTDRRKQTEKERHSVSYNIEVAFRSDWNEDVSHNHNLHV